MRPNQGNFERLSLSCKKDEEMDSEFQNVQKTAFREIY